MVQRAFSNQGRSGPEINIRYTPLSSTPQAESFSETNRVTLATEVVQVGVIESLSELFSTEFFVGLRILAES
jgi:hypothetical protein